MNSFESNQETNEEVFLRENAKTPALYMKIKELLFREAKAQTIAVGDRLLPEPELARHFHVSRNTLRRVLGRMEAEGMILRFPKKGTFLTRLPEVDTKDLPIIGVNFLMNSNQINACNSILNGVIRCSWKYNVRLMHINEKELTKMPEEVKGIIFVRPPSPDIPLYDRFLSGSIPSVSIGKVLGSKVGYVGVDNRKEASRGVCALVQAGCRKIGFWGNQPERGHARERYLGYEDALREAGLPILPRQICFRDPEKNSFEQAEDFLRRARPDAVFVSLLPQMFSLLYAMNQMQLRIGRDIRLLCFDDLRDFMMDWPSISYICMPLEKMGERAFRYLYHKIVLRQKVPVIHEVLPAEIHFEA